MLGLGIDLLQGRVLFQARGLLEKTLSTGPNMASTTSLALYLGKKVLFKHI